MPVPRNNETSVPSSCERLEAQGLFLSVFATVATPCPPHPPFTRVFPERKTNSRNSYENKLRLPWRGMTAACSINSLNQKAQGIFSKTMYLVLQGYGAPPGYGMPPGYGGYPHPAYGAPPGYGMPPPGDGKLKTLPCMKRLPDGCMGEIERLSGVPWSPQGCHSD